MAITVVTANKETVNAIRIRTTEYPNDTPLCIVLPVLGEVRNKISELP
jgi:hypothetical protein